MKNEKYVKRFENIVQIFTALGVITGVIASIYFLSEYLPEREYLKYATINGGSSYYALEISGNIAYNALKGLIRGIIWTIWCIISYYPLMSIVVLVESNLEIVKQNKELLRLIRNGRNKEESLEDIIKELPEL